MIIGATLRSAEYRTLGIFGGSQTISIKLGKYFDRFDEFINIKVELITSYPNLIFLQILRWIGT